MCVHCDDVVGVALHEQLLAGLDVAPDEDAAGGVVDLVVAQEEVGVVQRTEGEGGGELEEGVGRELADLFGFAD